MKNRKRTRIAEGIYQDQSGFAAVVQVGRVQKEQRYPPGTDLSIMQSWRIQMRAELDRDRPTDDEPAPLRGSWTADVARYLPQIAGRVSYKADRSHLDAWTPHVGQLNRAKITPTHVRTAIGVWLEAGLKPKTVRHRVRVLRELYQTLDGTRAKPPLTDVKLPKVDEPNPTPSDVGMIERVAASLKAGLFKQKRCGPTRKLVDVRFAEPLKTYVRFLVRATTGQRPSQIMRAEPGDVDFARGIWFVRSGKGGRQVPLFLQPDMIQAWQAFIAADAWGEFDTRSFSKTLRRHGWPKGERPYNLRHTFSIDHLLNGTNLGDLQGLLGHKQIETTRRFYAPVLLARLKSAGANRKLKLV